MNNKTKTSMKINTLIGSPRPKKIYKRQAEHLFKTVGRTFYVVDDRIISFREWHQVGRPKFDKSGEYSICSDYLDKRKNEAQYKANRRS